MAATVGIRSGLSRHWTGSLLELNCNSSESLNDYPDDVEDPFYVQWRTEITNRADAVQTLTGNDYICLTQDDHPEEYVYSKDDSARPVDRRGSGPTNLTPNQIFRLRQLISLLHRNFHHRYGKNPNDFSGKSSGNVNGSASAGDSNRPFEDLDHSNIHHNSQTTMYSLRRSTCLSNDHKFIHALFDLTSEQFFANEPSFLLLTKSKRRHCSSEGDLTFVSSPTTASSAASSCGPIQPEPTDHFFSSSSCFPDENTSSPEPSAPMDSEQDEVSSDDSMETLVEPVGVRNPSETEDLEETSSDESPAEQPSDVIVNTVPTIVAEDVQAPEKHLCEKDPSEPLDSPSEKLETIQEEQVPKVKAEIPHPTSLPLRRPSHDDCLDTLNDSVAADGRLTRSELSSPQVRKLEKDASNSQFSGIRLVKTVSFADEVGQSLTEVFLFRKTEEECYIPDYEDEFEAPFLSFLRKPKASSFGRFSRSRGKRGGFDDFCGNISSGFTNQSSYQPVGVQNKPPESSRCLWFLGFTQPAAQYYDFRQRIEKGCVSLENITLTQPDEQKHPQQQPQHQQRLCKSSDNQTALSFALPYLSGTIKVKNIHFDKKVWLRVTTNNWVTYTDCPAVYNTELSSGSARSPSRFDTFTFQISASDFPRDSEKSERIEFAIRYCAGHEGSHGQFWDNNEGRNYVIERRRVDSGWSSPTNSSPTLISSLNTSYNDYSAGDSNKNTTSGCSPYTVDYRPNFTGISSFTDYRAWEHFASESIYY